MYVGEIPVTIIRKPIRHIYLRVRPPDARVVISAGGHFSDNEIINFAEAHLDWLRKQIAKIKLQQSQLVFPPASQLIWGEPLEVSFQSNAESYGIFIEAEKLVVTSPKPIVSSLWDQLLGILLKNLVDEAAPPLIQKWRLRLKLPPISFGIRRMKSRWGTCYPAKKRIILNSELATKPQICLEKVILHELVHFFEHNHGPGFKYRMDKLMPDWRAIAKMLNNG